MSRSKESFEYAIKDAEELLAHFNALNVNPSLKMVKFSKEPDLLWL